MTPAKGYVYQGTGRSLTPEQAAAAAAKRNGRDPAVTTSRPASPPAPAPAPTVHGAVKVPAFPALYPFAEIARDGGVWQLDSTQFRAKPGSIRAAAVKWARDHSLKLKTVLDGDHVYLQFKGDKP